MTCCRIFKAMEYNHQFNDDMAWHWRPACMCRVSGSTCQLTEDYILAVQGLGIPFNRDFNGAQQRGVGTMQYTTLKGGAGMRLMPF